MSHHRLTTPDLGRVFRGETVLGLSEWQLLERYLECRDEVAFDAIVARHGPMVLAVCRRMLLNQTDVEDAFQATFLVLVRRARQLGPRDALGAWLYGVATRVALRARCEAARRRRVEPIAHDFEGVIEDRSAADRELGDVLDQELLRLPSKYRDPVVLCYLEGHTHEEAARQLRWPLGTVKGRLSRARDLLQSRLVRRGVAPGVGALTLAFSSELSAALHGELLDRMIQSTLKLATGPASAQIASRSITSLVEGVLTAMFLNSLKWAGVAAVLCGLVFTGVGVMARQDTKAKIEGARPAAPEVAADAKTDTPAAKPAASFVALPRLRTFTRRFSARPPWNGTRPSKTASRSARGWCGPIRPRGG
jgi:RNA polymerase sigma factor (sigma-70 family)